MTHPLSFQRKTCPPITNLVLWWRPHLQLQMDRIIVIDADGGKPRPSLDIAAVRLNRQADILKLLRERKIPLDRVAVADKGSGALYLAENTTLSSIHDPYTGDHVTVDPDFQTYIGSVELAGDGLCLHGVFVDESGSVCTDTGAVCGLRAVNLKSWTGAMLELTFGNGVELGGLA